MRTYQLRLRRAENEVDVISEAPENKTGVVANAYAGGGENAITDETNVAIYADLVEEVKRLIDELNEWVAGEGNAGEWMGDQ
ncbi:hypothetical protein V6N12_038606 [Hibiscus sabdariffa]